MKALMLAVLGWILACGILILLSTRLEYSIARKHFRVTLFGVCLRRVRLSNIESVSKRRSGWSEKWFNTLKPSHRVLYIRRRRGLFRDFGITPKNRYAFRVELERAIARDRGEDHGGTGGGDLERKSPIDSASHGVSSAPGKRD